jgi:hypothetical protein
MLTSGGGQIVSDRSFSGMRHRHGNWIGKRYGISRNLFRKRARSYDRAFARNLITRLPNFGLALSVRNSAEAKIAARRQPPGRLK